LTLPSSIADALPVGAETQLGKQEQDIASSGYRDPSGVAAGNEPFATISTTEKTVHHGPGLWLVVEPRQAGSIRGAM
jgi:hypothetical protein